MRADSVYFRAVIFMAAIAILAGGRGIARAQEEQAQGKSASFFGQGQAAYNAQDQVTSQQLAIQDLLAQAVTQAAAQFLSPAQIGAQFLDLQKKILSNAKKYVDSYQVFSENQAAGLYRVVGQVTVSLDLLQKDLEESGFPVAGAGRDKTAVAPASTGASDATPSGPAASDEAASDAPATAGGQTVVEYKTDAAPAQVASRGLSVTKKEILWAVAEKWEQQWILPGGRHDGQSLFAQGIVRELDDYDYTLHLPEPGSVKVDHTGNIPQTQVIALAQGLGIQEAVVGSVTLKQERNKLARLEANLRVIKVADGKTGGEIKREVSMEDVSNQEGAFDLASRIAPQLNSLLGGTGDTGRTTASTAPTGEQRAGGASSDQPPEAPGRWTLNLASSQFNFWREMERVLREQFKGMRVASLEMGPSEGTIRLDGVDGSFISRMNGTPLPSGAIVRIESFSTETKVIKLSFSPPGKVQTEQKR